MTIDPLTTTHPDTVRALLAAGLLAGAILLAPVLALASPDGRDAGAAALPAGYAKAAAAAKADLENRHGAREKARIERGVNQVTDLWRESDGDAAAFEAFLASEFLPAGEALDQAFDRLEEAHEAMGGYFTSMLRDLRRGVDLEIGPLLPIDQRLGGFDPSAHLSEDLFENKIAFVILLNFPLTTLDERLAEGPHWTRRQWAEARLAGQYGRRVPAEVNQQIAEAYSRADSYISSYNIFTHHLLTRDGKRLFPEGQRLITHWNLRDELKARYADPDGLPAQRMLQTVMEKIVLQEIPEAVIDNPLLDWTPSTGEVAVSPVEDAEPPAGRTATASRDREPDTRYEMWLGTFRASRLADPYSPKNPTLIDRRFNENREIPEKEVEALFESVLGSPLGGKVAGMISKRLGRDLEPFDVWYVGFKPRGKYQESDLDARTRGKYPTAEAYAADIPRLLGDLGFGEERARFLADHIVVDPSRGAGHAFGAARRDDKAHLRTRVNEDGMDYKGYNIAVHEMGHNVEQIFSLTTIDHTLLQGVPNTAFTEALAFVFQAHDLDLLGLGSPDKDAESMRALEDFWATREIAGVALVDMRSWRWLYDHPDATPAAFREAVVGIARGVWNEYFAPVIGKKDSVLLAVYSHMIDSGMYTPDYPLGHLIAFQIDRHFRSLTGPMGPEFERICKLGSITPDAWMRQAVGGPLSAKPLLDAAASAVEALDR